MSRPREKGTVYQRGRVYWLDYRVNGRRIQESAGTGDERAARALLAQRRREIRDGTWTSPEARGGRRELTVERYAQTWIERRKAAGVISAPGEMVDLERWFLSRFGDRPIHDVTRAEIRDAILAMRRPSGPRAGEPFAPRTVLKAYAAIRLLFADALADGLIAATPCTLRSRGGELPAKRDADPRWRAHSVYTREEAESLISDPRIPEDRRVYYALALLSGMRAGEVNGRQWRDLDAAAEPLGRLLVATQASRGEGERETKTLAVKEVPIHPTLAALLEHWRAEGFAYFFGRHPSPADLIVPSRADGRSPRSASMCHALREDLEVLGLRADGRSRHAMRSTFLTLLEVDGANMGIVRRATHAAPKDAFGGYLRPSWASVCAEISKLRIQVRRHAEVIPLRAAVGAPDGDSRGDSPPDHMENLGSGGGSYRIPYSFRRR